MNQNQFNQNFILDKFPKSSENDEVISLTLTLWSKGIILRPIHYKSGRDIFRLEILFLPEELKDHKFYESEEWEEKFELTLMELFYKFHQLFYEDR